MATKMLAASLQAVAGEGKRALTCLILNPKAMQIEQLYGHFEKDEWKVRYHNDYLFCLGFGLKNESIHSLQDGILANNFRQFSSLPKDERKWLIFDGPIDSEWIENMNTGI